MDEPTPKRTFLRFRQLRKKKLSHLVGIIVAEQSEIPEFLKSVKYNSEKTISLSIFFYILVIINLLICVYQTMDRVLHYMDEPTAVDAFFIETANGSFPYVYIFPGTTHEFERFAAKKYKNHRKDCNFVRQVWAKNYQITDINKYMSKPTYITDAYFEMKKSRINLTIQNYDSLVRPTVQVSSAIWQQYGDLNYNMIIKLKFPEECNWVYLLVHPSSVSYHLTYDTSLKLSLDDEKNSPIKYLLTTTVQKTDGLSNAWYILSKMRIFPSSAYAYRCSAALRNSALTPPAGPLQGLPELNF
uniref:Uncharacterized protein n=1 Tax=Strigamia maritima TaxID=126957 RepID=T1IWL3_STRMM